MTAKPEMVSQLAEKAKLPVQGNVSGEGRSKRKHEQQETIERQDRKILALESRMHAVEIQMGDISQVLVALRATCACEKLHSTLLQEHRDSIQGLRGDAAAIRQKTDSEFQSHRANINKLGDILRKTGSSVTSNREELDQLLDRCQRIEKMLAKQSMPTYEQNSQNVKLESATQQAIPSVVQDLGVRATALGTTMGTASLALPAVASASSASSTREEDLAYVVSNPVLMKMSFPTKELKDGCKMHLLPHSVLHKIVEQFREADKQRVEKGPQSSAHYGIRSDRWSKRCVNCSYARKDNCLEGCKEYGCGMCATNGRVCISVIVPLRQPKVPNTPIVRPLKPGDRSVSLHWPDRDYWIKPKPVK